MSVPATKENIAQIFLAKIERKLQSMIDRGKVPLEDAQRIQDIAVTSLNFFAKTDQTENREAYEAGMEMAIDEIRASHPEITDKDQDDLLVTFSSGLMHVIEANGDPSATRDRVALAWAGERPGEEETLSL